MYLAWRYGGADVFRLYNDLDANYLPLYVDADDEQPPAPRRPPYPYRLKAFTYACAMYAEEQAVKLAGGTIR